MVDLCDARVLFWRWSALRVAIALFLQVHPFWLFSGSHIWGYPPKRYAAYFKTILRRMSNVAAVKRYAAYFKQKTKRQRPCDNESNIRGIICFTGATPLALNLNTPLKIYTTYLKIIIRRVVYLFQTGENHRTYTTYFPAGHSSKQV